MLLWKMFLEKNLSFIQTFTSKTVFEFTFFLTAIKFFQIENLFFLHHPFLLLQNEAVFAVYYAYQNQQKCCFL